MRKIKTINQGWKFLKQPLTIEMIKTTDFMWEDVTIPHTWNAIDGANGNEYFRGIGWYMKEFDISQDECGQQFFIEFQGANSVCEVYVNDQYIGIHKGGYSTFRFDITDALNVGASNQLAVKVDNSEYADVYPLRADFTFYGGIYRDVQLIATHPVHIDLEDYGSQGIYISQTEVTAEQAILDIKTKLSNKRASETKVRLCLEFFDREQNLVGYSAQEVVVNSGKQEQVAKVVIEHPILWQAQANPYLYELKVTLQQLNDVIDEVVIPFGIRHYTVDADSGFYLNGKALRLQGVSRHQDRKDKGNAISKEDQQEDMALIREIGATSIRLAHYQHDQYFYDLCDQEGMVVWAEIPFITEVSKSAHPEENAEQQLIELIRQNYNHPSIFFWGIQNEIQIDSGRDQIAREIVQSLNQLAKQEDPTRLTSMANVLTVSDTDDYNYMTDIIGFNKYYGWYMGQVEDFADWIDQYHEKNPTTALAITEYGADGIIEYHSSTPQIKDYTEEYHALFHEKVWKIFSQRPFLWATYVWNMFDFGANIRDEAGVKGRNNKGLVTYDRKVKKDAFYLYKANWSQEPFVHIGQKRYVERADQEVTIPVYTNCQQVTLMVNGERIEQQAPENGVIRFENVHLSEGSNQLKVVDESGQYSDYASLVKVAEETSSYLAPVDDIGENVQNWFDQPEIDEQAIVEEVELLADAYSSRDTIEALMDLPETKTCLIETLGDLSQTPMYGMIKNMSIDTLMSMDNDSQLFSKQRVNLLNQKLVKIKK